MSSVASLSINALQFTAPYDELQAPVRCAYTYFVFANAVCARPTDFIHQDVGPYCLYTELGHNFDLPKILADADKEVKRAVGLAFGGGSFPTETSREVKLKVMDTIVPSILYILGAVCSFLSLFFIPRGFGKVQWSFGRKRMNLFLAFIGFAMLAAASALWTYKAKWIKTKLSSGKNSEYIEKINIGTEFLGMTWGSAVFMLIATVLLGVEYQMNKSANSDKEQGRGDFKRLLDNEEVGDGAYKGAAVQMTTREVSPQPSAKLQMPGYEPLRA